MIKYKTTHWTGSETEQLAVGLIMKLSLRSVQQLDYDDDEKLLNSDNFPPVVIKDSTSFSMIKADDWQDLLLIQ